MRHPRIIIAGIVVAVLATAGGITAAAAGTSAATGAPAPGHSAAAATVHTAQVAVGGKMEAILTTATGQPLYYYKPGTGQHGASCRARQQLRLLITQSRGRASTAAPPAEVHRAKAPPRVPQPAAAPQRHGLRETDMTVTRPASAGPRRPRLRAAPRGPSGTAAAPDRAAAPGTAPARERRRSMPVAHIAVAAVAVAALAAGGVAERAAVAASFAVLGNLHWLWIPGAIMLEAASMAALAIMLRRLLAAGGTSVAVRPMLATAFAANALSVSVPLAGPELATAFTFRRFTRQGADVPLAGWSLLAGGVVSAAAGILILGGGGLASGNIPAIAVAIPGSILAVATLVMTGAAMRQPRLRGALERPAAWALRHGSQLLRRPVAEPRQTIRAWADRLGSLQLPPSGWMTVTGLALANWLADAAVLAVSIRAAGATVPWHDLLLVYGSGIAAQSLNITPGGLGVAEGTLGVALAASGLRASQALAAVLLYRLASFWLVASAGWLVLLWLRRAHPRARRNLPNA